MGHAAICHTGAISESLSWESGWDLSWLVGDFNSVSWSNTGKGREGKR